MRSHRLIDERSLAFGRAIAARLADHPELIAQARATLVRWASTSSPRSLSTLHEWLAVLDGPPAGVIAVLTGEDERATRLRQSSPFAGLLPERERIAVIREYATRDAAAAEPITGGRR